MNIDTLRTFLAVVQTGRLNRAAERVHVSQSTVTARLDQLEAQLGQRLVQRSRKGAVLTKAGYAFLRHAEQIVQSWEQGKRQVGLPQGFSGVFSFACEADLWPVEGRGWLDRVAAAHPDLALEAWPATQGEARRWLESGLVDAALLSAPVSGQGLGLRRVDGGRIVQVSTLARAATQWHPDYVYADLGAEFRRQHTAAWPGDNTPARTFGSAVWARDYILEKGGSAYLPWSLVELDVAEGRLFPVEGAAEFTRSLSFVWREASAEGFEWLEESAGWVAPPVSSQT